MYVYLWSSGLVAGAFALCPAHLFTLGSLSPPLLYVSEDPDDETRIHSGGKANSWPIISLIAEIWHWLQIFSQSCSEAKVDGSQPHSLKALPCSPLSLLYCPVVGCVEWAELPILLDT